MADFLSSDRIIIVPNVLGGSPDDAEGLLVLLAAAIPNQSITLNLDAVRWISPYGATLLLGTCRYLAQVAGQPVHLTAVRDNVHAYLRRINFFEQTANVAFTSTVFDETYEFGRRAASPNVLELVPVQTHRDVYLISGRARTILECWLNGVQYDTDQIVSLIAEACSNVVDHSLDRGIVSIQKYDHQQYVDIELAISDLGQGIRQSLVATHGNLMATTCTGYIRLALDGTSARAPGRGGQGLGAMQRIATASGGFLSIRSETGKVEVHMHGYEVRDQLPFFPGTHIAITFRSRQ